MTSQLKGPEVESWLESNPDWVSDYFLRKVDIVLINKWLVLHGFYPLQDYITGRRGSLSQESSGQTSPDPGRVACNPEGQGHSPSQSHAHSQSSFFPDRDLTPRHQRSNSKKYLRHDFAKARMRSMFRTHEPSIASDVMPSLAERRSSLKGMRQFLSLPSTSGSMLSLLIQSKVRLPRYASKDEELKRELRQLNKRDFFLEIVKDISHELDLKSLTSRILVNVSILVDADRSSLFFVEGYKGKQTLVSKVFDAYTGTNCFPTSGGDNVVRVPWGQGIIGYVAETGKSVNIPQATKDPRYHDDVDRIVGYTTASLLCMPIRNAENEVIGVVQVINKRSGDGTFTTDNEKVLETYLAFCGLAISNAQGIEAYSREYDRNKALLEVVHDLFEEQTSVENVVMKIMQRAQSLLKCERCVVMLKDDNDNACEVSVKTGSISHVFDLQHPVVNGQARCSQQHRPELNRPNKIAEIVARTGETINITDARVDFNNEKSGLPPKSILCKPIRNSHFHTIGVAQLINKTDGKPFDESDDQLFEAFTIFCGLGINNCLLYDEVARAAAKQAVALEVLSYHATVPTEDVYYFKKSTVPESFEWGVNTLSFNDFRLKADEMVLAAIRMFMDTGLIQTFKIDYETLIRWLLTVRKNYRNIAYHNWRHAFNVCQFMFTLLTTCCMKKNLDSVEMLALIVACLCHDLDHRGTNNAFQQKTSSPLSQLYGTQATLEHHHFNHAVMILNSEGHNLFSNISSDEYSRVMKLLKDAILATDLSRHIQARQKFFPLVESGLYSWEDSEQRELLRSVLMTTCDIAAITKPWDIQRRSADLVVAEFLEQGDKEKTVLKIQPQAFMDREKQDELPRLQLEWIDGICLPLYKCLAALDAQFQCLYDGVLNNRAHWSVLDEERLAKTMVKGLRETAC